MNWWLVVAYSAFMALFFVYTMTMSRKQSDIDRRIEDLRKQIDENR